MKKIKGFFSSFAYFAIPCLVLAAMFFYSARGLFSKPAFDVFVAWMKTHGYSDPIIDIYKCDYRDPVLKLIINDYLEIRNGALRNPEDAEAGYKAFKNLDVLPLTFVEVQPVDKDAEFEDVNPSVLEKFRVYLEKRFGKNIAINHKKVQTNYEDTFGNILYSYETMFVPKVNPRLSGFVNQFTPPCIVKFDAENIRGKDVASIWEIRHCAVIMGKDFVLSDNLEVFDKYAHEFGHNIGLDHQFIDLKNLPRNEEDVARALIVQSANKYVGVDDVMIKVKSPENPVAGHYLSPLSRYVLEPVHGYTDDGHFGQDYSGLYAPGTLKRIAKSVCKE